MNFDFQVHRRRSRVEDLPEVLRAAVADQYTDVF